MDKLCKLVNILSVSLFLVSIAVYFFYLMANKVVYTIHIYLYAKGMLKQQSTEKKEKIS